MTGIISSCSKGIMIDDNTLGVLFNSKMTKSMIEKQNHMDVLVACATAAYGKPMNVVLLDPSDDIPGPRSALPQQERNHDGFSASVDVLRQLAADGNFTVSEQ